MISEENKFPELYGLVLAGGRSSRMGMDKGLIKYQGKPQRQHLFELLERHCSRVFTSCKKNQDVPDVLNPVFDNYEFDSPLNGILSAFDLNPGNAWLAVAVDMPLIDSQAIDFLINQRDGDLFATCFCDSDGMMPEPMFTIWEPHCLAELRAFQLQGGISPRQFLINNMIKKVVVPLSSTLTNVNSPADMGEIILKISD